MGRSKSLEKRRKDWKRLIKEARNCKECVLHTTRYQTVIYRGNPFGNWCFLAEAPGEEEDLRGKVLVGRSGKLFDKFIDDCGIARNDWCAVNTICCRPPGNKYPKPEIADICVKRYMWLKLDIMQPKILVIMGAHAAKFLLGAKKIGDAAGRVFAVPKEWDAPYLKAVMATYHPAYALRRGVVIGIIRSHLRYFVSYVRGEGFLE